MIDRLSDPKLRRSAAVVLLFGSLLGWPATHVLVIVLHPPESSWVFHLLLALSWFSLIWAAIGILVATDVRVQQEEGEDS